MAGLGFEGVPGRPLMPASGETVNGEPFVVPKGARSLTVHVPALVGAGATLKIQSLAPTATALTSQTWADAYAFDVTDGSSEALDGLVESTTVTLPVTATGGGTLRFVASQDQSSVPVDIPVFFAL